MRTWLVVLSAALFAAVGTAGCDIVDVVPAGEIEKHQEARIACEEQIRGLEEECDFDRMADYEREIERLDDELQMTGNSAAYQYGLGVEKLEEAESDEELGEARDHLEHVADEHPDSPLAAKAEERLGELE